MDDVPERPYMDDPDIEWKMGKPDYTAVNKLYLGGRRQKHAEGSLEKIVESLVKNWEVDASHKANRKDWRTVDKDSYVVRVNNNRSFNLDESIEVGIYNIVLDGCPLYDPEAETSTSSHELFMAAFPRGFAWEVIETYSGPPTVTFKWRHWGYWEGEYKGRKGCGQMIDVVGTCVVRVTSDLLIQSIDVYYDPSEMVATLLNFDRKTLCPADRK